MTAEKDLYFELTAYTLELRDPEFIHQHVVDAYAAQHAGCESKPIGVVFALIGLYLYIEKDFTGRQVQKTHMQLAKRRKRWITPPAPQRQVEIGVADVMARPPGASRNAEIRRWCEAVWRSWSESRSAVVAIVCEELGISV